MATEDTRDSQIWDETAARWVLAHQLAVAGQHALASEVDAYYLGTRPAPHVDAIDKVAASWVEADRLRGEMDAFIRARFG